MRHYLAIILLVATATPASAGDFTELVAALSSGTASYPKDCDMVVTPKGDVHRPCALSLTDLQVPAGATLRAKNIKEHDFARSATRWREADVEVVVAKKVAKTFHVVEVGGSAPDKKGNLQLTVQASQWNELVSDADAMRRARAGTLPAPAALRDHVPTPPKSLDDTARADFTQSIDDFKNLMTDGDMKDALVDWLDGGATLIGSAPGQALAGKAGAKVMKSWQMSLVRKGGLDIGAAPMVVWGAARITGTTKDKTPVAMTYTAFIVMTQHMTGGGGSYVSEPALIQFGLAP